MNTCFSSFIYSWMHRSPPHCMWQARKTPYEFRMKEVVWMKLEGHHPLWEYRNSALYRDSLANISKPAHWAPWPLTWPTRGQDDISSRLKWGSNGCKWTGCPSWAWLVCPGGPSFPLPVNCPHDPNHEASPPIWPLLGDNPAAFLIQL